MDKAKAENLYSGFRDILIEQVNKGDSVATYADAQYNAYELAIKIEEILARSK